MKSRFPFRLGTTSYILPSEIVPNVRFLADKVDDIEIVLFESGDLSALPSVETVTELKQLASEHALTYTVHLPIDIHTGHAEESERRRAVDACRRIIERLEPAAPFAYVLHLAADRPGPQPLAELSGWQALHRESLLRLLEHVAPHRLCLENLEYPFELVAGIAADLDLSICCDIGHLLRYGFNVLDHLGRYLARTRVVHLHGVAEGSDHRGLSSLPPDFFNRLMLQLTTAAGPERVATIEVFNERYLQESFDCLADWAAAQGGPA